MNNTSNNQFIIPFVGLKVGMHDFEFELTDSFFEENEYSLIQKGNVLVNLAFEKKETMMIGNYRVTGDVLVSCNRCNDDLDVLLGAEYKIVYKFDNAPSNDETLVIVYPEEFELDVRGTLLELINVSLPVRAVHDEGECNDDMLDLLDEYVVNADDDSDDELYEELDEELESESTAEDEEDVSEEIDPRWEALKNLKK